MTNDTRPQMRSTQLQSSFQYLQDMAVAKAPSTHCLQRSYSCRPCRKRLPTSRHWWKATNVGFTFTTGAEARLMQRIGCTVQMLNVGTVTNCFLRTVRSHVQRNRPSGDCVLNQAVVALLFGGEWKEPHLSENDTSMLFDTLLGFVRRLRRQRS